MATTRYFVEQVLRKRPYLSEAMCRVVLAAPAYEQVQADGRIRVWGEITDPRDGSKRFLRVVVLEDRQTLHNAFFDRDFVAP
ncbi:MAG TPA: hypothetical protein VEA77_07240 [Hyphomicrobium sp.]|nr:hypothetical protein [Hyphomicrobium sp.]